jgi:small GTP-binding protein
MAFDAAIEQPPIAKCVLLGEAGVGKTSLLARFNNTSPGCIRSTVSVDFYSRIIDVGGMSIKMQLWDTAGADRYRSLSKMYFRGGVGVMMVFDVTRQHSFDSVGFWLDYARQRSDHGMIVTLVGNKSDLAAQRIVSADEAAAFAAMHSMEYVETSALTAHNVEEVFVGMARRIRDNVMSGAFHVDESTQRIEAAGATLLSTRLGAGGGGGARTAPPLAVPRKDKTISGGCGSSC